MNTILTTVQSIAPYVPNAEKPWNEARVKHLYHRLGFGATRTEIAEGLLMNPGDLVDQLLDNAAEANFSSAPYWADYTREDYVDDDNNVLLETHKRALRNRWVSEMINEGVKSKLALFWHNHFVTEEQTYNCSQFMWRYYKLLHDRAFGNFKVFVEEMGKNPAMLVYLNNVQNIKQQPNENYARELLELFTMGEGNGYTQRDVEEISRALTGWRFTWYECTYEDFRLEPYFFDEGIKTIFGTAGFYGYDEVHDKIFEARADQVAEFITGKLYKFYLYEKINPTIVNELATTFKDNNWEIMPVLKQLFKSEFFYEENFIGANVKSPIELMVSYYKMAGLEYPADVGFEELTDLNYYSFTLGQELFNPVNVAGWDGYRTWLNENTLTSRWNTSSEMTRRASDRARAKLVQLAIDLAGTINDEVVIVQALANHFLSHELNDEHLEAALDYFKGEIPENYFEDDSWNLYYDEAPDQIINLMYYLMRLPEYQLS